MRIVATAAFLITAGCIATAALACDTPVFRYAMYKWAPAPYEIYYFYDDAPTPASEAVQKEVESLANQLGQNANVVFTAISADEFESTQGKIVPVDVRRGYEARKEKGGPMFAVYSPVGQAIHWGDLSPQDIAALCSSPARRKVAAALASGSCCVYVILDGKAPAAGESPPHPETDSSDEPLTGKTAEVELAKMLADLASGEITLLSPPPKDGPAVDNAKPVANSATVVRVSRNDPAEAWFVRTLLGVEPDLSVFSEPMVFPVFGRGRALPPFIGRGIRGELLIEAMEFATGACSCTVKDQNPGVDLLMTEDWEAAAEKLAARFGAEEGNEGLFADVEFLPEILVPDAGDNEPAVNSVGLVDKSDGNEEAPNESDVDPSNPENSQVSESAENTPNEGGETEPSHESTGNAEHASDRVAMVDHGDADHGDDRANSFDGSSTNWRMLGIIGAGIGVGLLALLAATFFVARPK